MRNLYENLRSSAKSLRKLLRIDTIYIVLIMILIYTVTLSYYTIMKYYTFQTLAYDFGIFLNSFWNTIYQGKFFYTTLWEGSRFQNHFSPILFFILPIYAIFPKKLPETLLIIQSFILALGALPIYWIAKNEISKKAGLIFVLLYLTYPALHGTNRFDFHEVVLAPTMILFAFHYFKEKRYNISGIFIVLALISREDVAMVIVPMAMLWLWERKDKWSIKDKETIFCISTIFIGLVWFIITTKYIIPIFSSEGYWFVMEYKPSYLLIDTVKKYKFIGDVFLPLLFMPFFNKWILPASPIFARILFSDRNTRYSIKNQHTALIIPFIFLSSIYVVKYLSETLDDNIKSIFSKKLLYILLVAYLMMSFFISPLKDDILKHGTIPQLAVVPDGGPITTNTLLTITPHYNALKQIIDKIPTNASVYTQNNIFPHMADRPKVYYVMGDDQIFRGWNNPQTGLIVPWKEGDFEYILTDNTNKDWSVLRNLDIESKDILQKNYGLYLAIDQIYLFKRGYNGTINTPASLLDNFDNGYIGGYYNGVLISYYNNNNLSGYPVLTDRVENINFSWKKFSPIPGVIDRDNFSVRFDGYIYVPQNGYYSFQLSSDGGSELFIDGQLAIGNWLSKGSIKESFQNYLVKGLHRIHIDYKEHKDNTYINLNWFTPWKGLFEAVPEEYFYIPKNLDNFTMVTNVSNNATNNTNVTNNMNNATNNTNVINNMNNATNNTNVINNINVK